MSQSRRTVSELGNVDYPSFWVSEQSTRREPESPAEARFTLQRSASGLWSVAVRGYNGGDQLPVELSDDVSDAQISIGDEKYVAVEGARPVHEVTPDLEDRYFDAMYDPEVVDNLLVQVLEEERAGVFSVMPGTGRHVGKVGQLIFESTKLAAVCWDFYDPTAKFEPVTIAQHGPEYTMVSAEGDKLQRFSSLLERTNYHPTFAVMMRDMSDPGIEEDFAFAEQLHRAG